MRLLTRAYISQLSRTSAIGCSRETRGRAFRLCSFFFVKTTTTTMTLKPYRCTSSTFRTRRCNCHLLSARSLSFWNGLVWSSLMVLSSKERRGVVRSQILFPRTCRLLLQCNRYNQIRKKFTPLRILFPLTHCVWILLLPQQQYELNEIDLTSRCCFSFSSCSCSCSSSFSVLKRFFCRSKRIFLLQKN